MIISGSAGHNMTVIYTGCTLKLLLTSIKKSNLSVRKCQKSNLTAHIEKNFKKATKVGYFEAFNYESWR